MGTDMSGLTLQKSGSARVKALANKILKDKTAENKDFQKLLQGGLSASAGTTHGH